MARRTVASSGEYTNAVAPAGLMATGRSPVCCCSCACAMVLSTTALLLCTTTSDTRASPLRNIWSMDADSNLPDFGFNLSGAEIIDLTELLKRSLH